MKILLLVSASVLFDGSTESNKLHFFPQDEMRATPENRFLAARSKELKMILEHATGGEVQVRLGDRTHITIIASDSDKDQEIRLKKIAEGYFGSGAKVVVR